MIPYTPPTADDLQNLKDRLGLTGQQMAALASVSDGAQWRKYTGGSSPRDVNIHMLFFIAARLALTDQELERVVTQMQEIGAGISFQDFK
ncbi:MAG: XRE family transcriptional regulator [Burkholderiaceae bacterium]